jgi:hypothetical protein
MRRLTAEIRLAHRCAVRPNHACTTAGSQVCVGLWLALWWITRGVSCCALLLPLSLRAQEQSAVLELRMILAKDDTVARQVQDALGA